MSTFSPCEHIFRKLSNLSHFSKLTVSYDSKLNFLYRTAFQESPISKFSDSVVGNRQIYYVLEHLMTSNQYISLFPCEVITLRKRKRSDRQRYRHRLNLTLITSTNLKTATAFTISELCVATAMHFLGSIAMHCVTPTTLRKNCQIPSTRLNAPA